MLQPYSQIDWINLSPKKFYTQYPIKTKSNKFVANLLHIWTKNKTFAFTCICWSTFGSNSSLKSFWVWCYKLGAYFGQNPTFFFAEPLKLHQVGWGASCTALSRCPVGRWTFAPVQGPEHSAAGYHQGCLCTLLHSSFPRPWVVSQFLLLKNISTAWCCHHRASQQGWY